MGIPARPHWQPQGPATRCMIGGKAFGWLNCTPTSFAMAMEKATLGRVRMTGCDVRKQTGDLSGGTMLSQCAAVAHKHGVEVEVHAGSGVVSPFTVAIWLHNGRGVVAQGNTSALINTPFRSTQGGVNHAVYINEGRGWKQTGDGKWYPSEVLVYDPAADGRKRAYHVDQGPSWWPWSVALAFFAALKPWGDNDPRRLGLGKVYCAQFADTEPHVHLRYAGSVRTNPFPRPMTVRPPSGTYQNVRSGPSTSYGIVTKLKSGTPFTAYQQNPKGQLLAGSRVWYGDHDGKRWIHSSGLK